LVFDYQGSLTGEMIDHGFLRQDSIMHRSLQRLECRINDLPDAIITSSSHAAQLLRGDFACRCPLIHTVPDGVDAGRFCRQSVGQVQDLRQKLGLPAKGRIVAYLGKLAGYQGTDLLLEAAATLCARHSDLHFLLMGYPQVDEYQAKASAWGLRGRITFTGRIPYEEAPRYLALADVAVAPKLSETESNGKLLDYMALGLPTVAFDTPVAREYLGKWGRYAARQDAGTLAATLEGVLLNWAEMGQLGQQLRARAIQLYSWRQAGERIEQIYGMLLANMPEKFDYVQVTP
jgi:glycosyltransferase involved in cell wall biosynthesis